MEESVKKLIDTMIDKARNEANKLAAQYEAEGQLALPQPLAIGEWHNSNGEEFAFAITLDLSTTDYGRAVGLTTLKLYSFYGEKFIIDSFKASSFTPFEETVSSDEFRKETERMIDELTADDGVSLRTRIDTSGILAEYSLVIPESAQMDLQRLPSNCTLSVFGEDFEGVEGIKDYVRRQTDNSRPYIIDFCRRFPCFDAEDYATERRFYRNFLFCRSKAEAEEKARKMTKLTSSGRDCLVSNDLDPVLRPMVYFEDESPSMLLAF